MASLAAGPPRMAHCAVNDKGVRSFNDGDTAFMLFAATVVMLQTPAMGIAQAGMIRRKNSLSMIMQTMSGMALGSLLWFVFGFSLTFGPSVGGVIGNFEYVFFDFDLPLHDCIPSYPAANTIPAQLFGAFQMMFALMTPVIVTGAWCEKMDFKSFLVFIVLWPILVYYPTAHWVWNANGWLNTLGVLDFAGGTVIHESSGIAGLVVSIILQRRKPTAHVSHHNLPLTAFGAAFVWSGWYSFNGGSAYKASLQASVALLNTHIAACAGGVTWMLLRWREERIFKLTEFLSGVFAALGSITAGSGFVKPSAALCIAICAATGSYYSVKFFKGSLLLDDVLDCTSLQGVPGIIGALAVGLFASPSVQPPPGVSGFFNGGGIQQVGVQLLAILVVGFWSATWTTVIMLIMKRTVALDISPDDEETGLDKVQIGEQAYDEELSPLLDLGKESLQSRMCEAAATGNVEEVRAIVLARGDPSLPDYDLRTPAHLAAGEGRNEILEFLLMQRATINPVDRFGHTPLHDAFSNKRESTVELLRKHGAWMNTQLLARDILNAAATNDADKVRELLAVGVNVDEADYDMRTPLMVASSEGHAAVVTLLLRGKANTSLTDRWGHTAVQSAVAAHHTHLLSMFLLDDHKMDGPVALGPLTEATPLVCADRLALSRQQTVQFRAVSPNFGASARELCTAASQGDVTEIQRILSKGADPNVGDYDGRTAMHLAASYGSLNVIRVLISARANLNAVDRWHRTPLQDATANCHLDTVRWLREHGGVMTNHVKGYDLCKAAANGDLVALEEMMNQGCDLNVADYDSRTALHLAACNNKPVVVQWLLAHGAVSTVTDRYGMSPLEDAQRYGNEEIIKYLMKANRLRNSKIAGMLRVPSPVGPTAAKGPENQDGGA